LIVLIGTNSENGMRFTQENKMDRKIGLYIHIPFCIKKCKYCDFISFCDKNKYFDEYIDQLLIEAKEYKGMNVDTVFIGGGTPTVFNEKQIERLILGIREIFLISDDAEFSVESNPGTLSLEKLLALKRCGINRLSIGVQSFNDTELKAIGRIHNCNDAYKAVEDAKRVGFENINIDLMLNLPQQTINSLEKNLKTATVLDVSHISCYSLILEENTPLYNEYQNGVYTQATDDYDRELYHFTTQYLKEHGYNRYEISNFCKPLKECKHNIKYWSCKEYVGLGVAAHSYLDGIRYFNTSDFGEYINGEFHKPDREILSDTDKICEYMIMKLRMSEGINENEFFSLFGVRIEDIYKSELDKFQKLGLLIKKNSNYFLTDYGIDISNSVLCEFIR